jgi:Bacterial Ig-like domain (group 2)
MLTVTLATSHVSSAQSSATLLQITSPADQSRVAPGQTVSVTVTSSADTSITAVGVVGEDPIGLSNVATSVPAQFSLAIPDAIACGPHMLTAMGTTASGQGVQSATILIDVERPDMPVKLSALMSDMPFEAAGEQLPVIVLGTFSDGKVFDLRRSSNLVYSSNNPSVASVDANGVVTFHSPGSGLITATYRKDGQNTQLNVPISSRYWSGVPFNVPPGKMKSTTPAQQASDERTTSGKASVTIECRSVRPGMSKGEVLGLFTPKTSLPINKEVACVQCFPRERFAQNTWRLEGREMDCVVDFDANGKVLRTRFVAAEPD